MKTSTSNRQRGVALLFAIFALLLMTAIGAALIFMASTDTTVNYNYRQEQLAFYGAKAGIEEARARMMASDPNSINTVVNPLPTLVPAASNNEIIYIINPGATANSVKPWDNTSGSTKYPDDELCHDGYGTAFGTAVPPDVRCDTTGLPSGTWYTSYNSQLPFDSTTTLPSSNTSPFAFKWVRIAPKVNDTLSYLVGSSSAVTVSQYLVNGNSTIVVNGKATAISPTQLVCYDGVEELYLTAATGGCTNMSTTTYANLNNVYTVTSLGVSPAGARKMIQADIALQPTAPYPAGMIGTSFACGTPSSIDLSGGSKLTVASYTTSNGTVNTVQSGGTLGSNGEINIGGATVDGDIDVLQPQTGAQAGTAGSCQTPYVSSGGTILSSPSCLSGNTSNEPTSCYLSGPYSFTPPPIPTGTYGAQQPASCATGSGLCMSSGTYGDISESGNAVLYMTPGTYNINSLSLTGKAQLIVSPAGAVTIYIGGCADNKTPCTQMTNKDAIDVEGNGIANGWANGAGTDYNSNDFTINYGGTAPVVMGGNGTIVSTLFAPQAPLTMNGGGNQKGNGSGATSGTFYGAIIANTITMNGHEFFYYDQGTQHAPANTGYLTMISYREVPY